MPSIDTVFPELPRNIQGTIETVLRALALTHGQLFAQAFVAEHFSAILNAHRGRSQSVCGEINTVK